MAGFVGHVLYTLKFQSFSLSQERQALHNILATILPFNGLVYNKWNQNITKTSRWTQPFEQLKINETFHRLVL